MRLNNRILPMACLVAVAGVSFYAQSGLAQQAATATPGAPEGTPRAGKGGGAPKGQPNNDPPNLRELSEKDVMNVLELVRKEFNVDDRRTYLMGHSMGGAGTLYLSTK